MIAMEMYCVKHHKFRKFLSPKICYVFNKTLVFSITCKNYGNNNNNWDINSYWFNLVNISHTLNKYVIC